MNKEIRIIFRKIAIMSILFLVLDFSIGSIARYIFFQQKSGKWYRITYSLEKAQSDIFIFGSSHAVRHYDPQVFEKEIGLSCYNAGVEGQQIVFNSTLQEIILKRATPKIILYDIDVPSLYESKIEYEKLSDLNPYYFKYSEIIGRVAAQKNRFEKYYLLSRIYQYNSTIAHIIRYLIAPQRDYKGFLPHYGNISENQYNYFKIKVSDELKKDVKPNIDKIFVSSIKQFILNSKNKNIEIIIIISPNLIKRSNYGLEFFKVMNDIVSTYKIRLISFENNPIFIDNISLFTDDNHLNNIGAHLFSLLISKRIKNELGLCDPPPHNVPPVK